ncbi:hypothetical protein HKX42_03815 [Salinisphaera sp. USBA-960]|nr:hypothetical protein [Salifodinibacter halophilus]NNC26004.1 hypothetical protein [Salifodinibacter halophilus]
MTDNTTDNASLENVADTVAAALALRHDEPEQAMHLADHALAIARTEAAYIELEMAGETVKTARHAMVSYDHACNELGDDAEALNAARVNNWKVYQMQQCDMSGVYGEELKTARAKVDLARYARRYIEDQMLELAPELVAHH